MLEFFRENALTLITAIGGISAWGYERKKRKQELESVETQNQKSAVDLYQEVLDDLKTRYDKKFEELEADLEGVRKNLELWKTKYRKLKEEFDTYKKNHNS